MAEPVTTLDRRYSDPEATATSWAETLSALEQAQLFWLATLRQGGPPHLTPVVAVWVADALHFTTGKGEQKAVNLRANAKVTLLTGCNGWQSGLDIVLEGEAVPVRDQARLEQLALAWRERWDGSWQYQAQDGRFLHPQGFEVLAFAVRPEKVLAFAKGTFSHTTHRF